MPERDSRVLISTQRSEDEPREQQLRELEGAGKRLREPVAPDDIGDRHCHEGQEEKARHRAGRGHEGLQEAGHRGGRSVLAARYWPTPVLSRRSASAAAPS